MTLILEIAARANLSEAEAAQAGALLLAALDRELPPEAMAAVRQAIPDAGALVAGMQQPTTSAVGADWDAELAQRGLSESQIQRVAEALTAVLFQRLGESASARIAERVPSLSHRLR